METLVPEIYLLTGIQPMWARLQLNQLKLPKTCKCGHWIVSASCFALEFHSYYTAALANVSTHITTTAFDTTAS